MSDQIVSNVLEKTPPAETDTCDIMDFGCHLDWFLDQLSKLFLWVWDGVLSGLATVIHKIPLPEWTNNIRSLELPPSVSWAIEPFQPAYGVTIIMSAYVLRFIIRRLPVVG